MSIASRIEAIEQHLTDDYSVLTLAGADLTNVDKNILNLKPTWKERLLYFMNNGTQEVWDNWEKVVGEGTTITLNNTEEAPMKIVLKGNTSQETTTGKNKLGYTLAKLKTYNTVGTWNNNVYSYNNLTFTVNDDMSVTVNGTANANTAFNLMGGTNVFVDLNIENGNYILSGSTGGNQDMSTWCVYLGIKHSDNTTVTIFSYNGDITYNKTSGDTFFPLIRIGSGTALNNINFYPMIRVSTATSEYEEPTGGTISPCPDYPQDIHVVSGDNSIEVCGKNLYNGELELGSINPANGNLVSDNSRSRSINFVKVKPNTTYSISKNVNSIMWVVGYTSNKIGIVDGGNTPETSGQASALSALGANINSGTFTTTSTTEYIKVYFTASNSLTTNIMLNEGSTALPYEAYKGASYPITLPEGMFLGWIPNTDYRDKIDKSSGKNLFDYDYISNYSNTTFSSYRYIKINGYDKNKRYLMSGIDTSNFDNLTGVTVVLFNKPNYSGLISDSSICYNSNHFSVEKKTIETNLSTTGDLYLGFYTANNVTEAEYEKIVNKLKLVQLEETTSGDTPTSYEPYGTGWYVKKEIGKVVYTGASDESWNLVGSTFNWFSIRNDNIDTSNYTTIIKILCDYYKARTYANTINSGECTTYQNGVQHMIAIKNTDISSVENFKTWLSSNNTTVYYVLATPTYTEITDSTLLSQLNALAKSYAGQTNISQENNDLASILNAIALREMA